MVFPAVVEDVSEALRFARSQDLEIAVKGGGHASIGSSSTDGGLCIDLSLMREISVDTHKRTIRAGGGALWSDVYAAGEAHGLACVGGAVDDTGVGGLTLGGGYGYMSGAHGLVIDNLLEIEFVLADGSITTASEKNEPDLFWAARGAGAGLGVATSFLYQAHEQKGPVWGGLLIFSPSQLGPVIEAGNDFINLNEEKGSLVVSIVSPPPNKSMVILALVYYNGAESEARKTFASLLQLEHIADTTGMISYPEINKLFSSGTAVHGMRHSMKGSAFTFPLAPSFANLMLEELSSFIEKVPDASSSLIAFEFFPYHKITAVRQSDTAFANRGEYGNLLCIMGWRDPVHDEICRAWARNISKRAKSHFESTRRDGGENSEKGVGEYFNYDGTCGHFKCVI